MQQEKCIDHANGSLFRRWLTEAGGALRPPNWLAPDHCRRHIQRFSAIAARNFEWFTANRGRFGDPPRRYAWTSPQFTKSITLAGDPWMAFVALQTTMRS
jgi:hypothetical protein